MCCHMLIIAYFLYNANSRSLGCYLDFISIFYTLRCMHIIVDIRTTSVHDMIPIRAWLAWAHMWARHRPQSVIHFLVHDHQAKIDGFNTLVINPSLNLFFRTKPIGNFGNQIFRSVNFSAFWPYDPKIPTISHIHTNASVLYSDPTESTIIKKYNLWKKKKMFSSNTALVVPDIQVGREIVWVYDIPEDHIEIIPYTPVPYFSSSHTSHNISLPSSFFIYDGWYGNESNMLIFLSAWEQYRRAWGSYELLLIWSAMEKLSSLTQIIRSLWVSESVHYLGGLDEWMLHTIYQQGKWWIYIGPYYSAGITIEYTQTYGIPLLLSDIPAFERYDGIKIHPNHTSDIVQWLIQLQNMPKIIPKSVIESGYISAYEKILTKI